MHPHISNFDLSDTINSIQPIFDFNVSPAIAISDTELAYFHTIRFVLKTHKYLNDNDIDYASNFICSFYSHSHDNLSSGSLLLTDDQLIMFLVYSNQRGICKFALIFNEELDNSIKSKDDTKLKRILLGPKEMFVELYDNTFLPPDDRDFIIRLIARESFATVLLIQLLKQKILNLEDIVDTYSSLQDFSNRSSDFILQDSPIHKAQIVTLTTKCYDEVCIQDSTILEDDQVRAIMSKYEQSPDSIYTIDNSPSSKTPQVYCFNTLDLISSVTSNNPINPKSQQPFSPYALTIINQRFHKEIAMYRRYLQITHNSTNFSK